jgi:ribose/xylose/arabinose/galactoside ABC-type transport system permease subunit
MLWPSSFSLLDFLLILYVKWPVLLLRLTPTLSFGLIVAAMIGWFSSRLTDVAELPKCILTIIVLKVSIKNSLQFLGSSLTIYKNDQVWCNQKLQFSLY